MLQVFLFYMIQVVLFFLLRQQQQSLTAEMTKRGLTMAENFAAGAKTPLLTNDDLTLGVVDAKWGLEEYTATFNDDDMKFVGAIDPKSGMFTPALDGPNPERSGDRNNIGDVWITADYTPDGSTTALKARAQLVVMPPVYLRWMASEVGK